MIVKEETPATQLSRLRDMRLAAYAAFMARLMAIVSGERAYADPVTPTIYDLHDQAAYRAGYLESVERNLDS